MKVLSIIVAALLAVSLSAQAKTIQLSSTNSVTFRGEVDDDSAAEVQLELMKLVAKRGFLQYPIYLVMDSPGGSIDAGNNFIEFTKTIPNLETVTIFAASMASAIVEHLPGRRNIIGSGILMFHRAKGGIQGQFEDGELESRLTLYKNIVRGMERRNAARMCISLESYKAQVKDELWILGSDAVSKKAADEVVDVTCTMELMNKPAIKSVSFMGTNLNIEFNGCPMIKSIKVSAASDRALFEKYRAQMNWRTK